MPSILELVKNFELIGLTNYQAGVYYAKPAKAILADYWITNFGAEDQTSLKVITVQNVKVNGDYLFQSPSLAYCLSTINSFYWDFATQTLYTNLSLSVDVLFDLITFGASYNFCSGVTTYIDDEEYIPVLLQAPSIAQTEDLIDYDLLDFINGNFELDNNNQDLDFLVAENIIGNEIFYSHLPDNKFTRADLIRLGSYTVNNYTHSETRVSINAIDKRVSGNISIPTETFSDTIYPNIDPEKIETIIPLIYGQVRETGVIVVNSVLTSGQVDCVLAQELTSLGTVQVNIDNIWTTVTPSYIDLTTGFFTLSESDGRNTNGSIRDIKVLQPVGIEIDVTTDIIKDLALRYENAKFDSFNFDLTAWEDVAATLSTGAYMINDKILLYDAYRDVQNGSKRRFRYEFTPDGKRTLKINNENIFARGLIYHQDFDDIEVESDGDIVFSRTIVNYSKNYYNNNYIKVKNNDNESYVKLTFGKSAELPVNSLLTSNEDAIYRAKEDSDRFSIYPLTTILRLKGSEFLGIQIYDIFNVELFKTFADLDTEAIIGREFYGFRRCQVLSIDPDSDNKVNVVKFKILGYAKFQQDLIFDDGDYLVFDDYIRMTDDGLE